MNNYFFSDFKNAISLLLCWHWTEWAIFFDEALRLGIQLPHPVFLNESWSCCGTHQTPGTPLSALASPWWQVKVWLCSSTCGTNWKQTIHSQNLNILNFKLNQTIAGIGIDKHLSEFAHSSSSISQNTADKWHCEPQALFEEKLREICWILGVVSASKPKQKLMQAPKWHCIFFVEALE